MTSQSAVTVYVALGGEGRLPAELGGDGGPVGLGGRDGLPGDGGPGSMGVPAGLTPA